MNKTNNFFKVMDEDWDILIVLDACRFDYFSELYKEFFKGDLLKKKSLGSHTTEWFKNNFKGYYPNVVYISGNPFINTSSKNKEFNAINHFKHIINVWSFGWDDDLGTVPPQNITKAVKKTLKEYQGKKMIIHYLQPHEPYIGNFVFHGYRKPDPSNKAFFNGIDKIELNPNKEILFKMISFFLIKLKIIRQELNLRLLLNLPPNTPMDIIRRKYGVFGLMKAYIENLVLVMREITELCRFLEENNYTKLDRIVITSDHGEFLGENGMIGHIYGSNHPILKDIPVFRIKEICELNKSYKKPITDNKNDELKKLQNQIHNIVDKLQKNGRI
jgi:hypothetical protein